MSKITEEELALKIEGVGLTEREVLSLRQSFGLPIADRMSVKLVNQISIGALAKIIQHNRKYNSSYPA